MAKTQIKLKINGRVLEALVEPRTLLIHFLREQLNLTGSHIGCETSHCGACTVDLDGKSVKSCTVLAVQADGSEVLTVEGLPVNGVGDTPNIHDILTGSDTEGRALPGTLDTTCGNWTSSAATGSAMVGHHDRTGGGSTSWNSAQPSRGCSQANLVSTGGAGLLYCFGAN